VKQVIGLIKSGRTDGNGDRVEIAILISSITLIKRFEWEDPLVDETPDYGEEIYFSEIYTIDGGRYISEEDVEELIYRINVEEVK